MISSSNTGLILKPGFELALVDTKGNIIKQGQIVSNEVFDAMTKHVVDSFCSRFSGFTSSDFKQSA